MNDQGMIFYRYQNNELNPEAIQGDNIPEWVLQANTRKFSGCFRGTKGKDFQLLIVSGNRQHIGLLHPQSKITELGQLTAGIAPTIGSVTHTQLKPLEKVWQVSNIASGDLDGMTLSVFDKHLIADIDGDGYDELVIYRDDTLAVFKLQSSGWQRMTSVMDRVGGWNLGSKDRIYRARLKSTSRDSLLMQSERWMGVLDWSSHSRRLQSSGVTKKPAGWTTEPQDKLCMSDMDGDGLDEIFIHNSKGTWACCLQWSQDNDWQEVNKVQRKIDKWDLSSADQIQTFMLDKETEGVMIHNPHTKYVGVISLDNNRDLQIEAMQGRSIGGWRLGHDDRIAALNGDGQEKVSAAVIYNLQGWSALLKYQSGQLKTNFLGERYQLPAPPGMTMQLGSLDRFKGVTLDSDQGLILSYCPGVYDRLTESNHSQAHFLACAVASAMTYPEHLNSFTQRENSFSKRFDYAAQYLRGRSRMNTQTFTWNDSVLADAEVCLIQTNDALLVSYRGTEGGFLGSEWLNNLFNAGQYAPYGWGSGVKVHKGFWQGLNAKLKKVSEEIVKAYGQGKKICYTGHSLGAALAAMLAFDLKVNNGIEPYAVTLFACPVMGNSGFKQAYEMKLGHLTNAFMREGDPVSVIPDEVGYVFPFRRVNLIRNRSGYLEWHSYSAEKKCAEFFESLINSGVAIVEREQNHHIMGYLRYVAQPTTAALHAGEHKSLGDLNRFLRSYTDLD